MANKNPKFNASGCPDPTAYEALKPIIKEDTALENRVNTDNNAGRKLVYDFTDSLINYVEKLRLSPNKEITLIPE